MLGDALVTAFNDLATGIGWVVLGVVGYVLLVFVAEWLFYLARGGEKGWQERESRKFPDEYKAFLAQQHDEIRCMGGRRCPENPEQSSGRRRAA